jgi:hypothetical protein
VPKLSKEEDQDLPPGDYTYPFSFVLAENLPSTFTHAVGQIVYVLKAVISLPWLNFFSVVFFFTNLN